jgi:hypothetical protein
MSEPLNELRELERYYMQAESRKSVVNNYN